MTKMTKIFEPNTKTSENTQNSVAGSAFANGVMIADSSGLAANPFDDTQRGGSKTGVEFHNGTNNLLLTGLGVVLNQWGGYWPHNGQQKGGNGFGSNGFFPLGDDKFSTDANGSNGFYGIEAGPFLKSDYGHLAGQFGPGGFQNWWQASVEYGGSPEDDFLTASHDDETGAAIGSSSPGATYWPPAYTGNAHREYQGVQRIADAGPNPGSVQSGGEAAGGALPSDAALTGAEIDTAVALQQGSIDDFALVAQDNPQDPSQGGGANEDVVISAALSDADQAKAAVALRDLATALYTVGGASSLANRPLKILKYGLKSVSTLVKNRDDLENGATKLQKIAKVFSKVGPTKVVGKIAEKVAGNTKKKLDAIEKKLDDVESVTIKAGTLIEKISTTLSKISAATEAAGILADVYSRKLAVAGQNLESAKQLFDTGIPFFGSDNRLTTQLKLQVALAGEKNKSAATEIEGITGFVNDLVNNLDGITDLTDWPGLNPLQAAVDAFRKISDALSPIFDPLSKVYDAVGPVLDALGSFFGFLLKPAEWALEAILDALGINDLLDRLADEILSFLPGLDVLDGLAARFEAELLPDLRDFLAQIEAKFINIEDLLNSATFPKDFSVATNGDDILYGSMNDEGPRLVEGLDGNDIITGGNFDDTLKGGNGRDILIGGGGDDLLDGGNNTAEDPDIVIYNGSIDDYGIVSRLKDGKASGTWFVADYRDDGVIAGTDIKINSGTDELVNIEVIFFSDAVLDLREIDTFIRTRSKDGEFARVTPFDTTLPPIAGEPQITADRGNDRIFGGFGLDVLVTGGGKDQLTSDSNGPKTIDLQEAVGDFLKGGIGNDIYISGPRNGGLDYIWDDGGIDAVDYKLHESATSQGLNIFLGSTFRELLYRPTSITIDADPVGRVVPGNRFPVGVLYGIENIDGTEFADNFYGTDQTNKINGGAGNDLIRGLDGDDTLLGGAGNDTLIGDGGDDLLIGGAGHNTYIGGLGDDYIVDNSGGTIKYAAFAEGSNYSRSVDVVDFLTTGFSTFNPYNMPGGIVVLQTHIPGQQQVSKYETSIAVGDRYGVDYIEGLRTIVGSIGRDIIHTSRDISQTIYGNDGDDELFSGIGETANTFFGGPGNDLFISDSLAKDLFFGGADSDTVRIIGQNNVDGDRLFGDDNRSTPLDGIDVLDLSRSDFSWHIYMKPGANGDLYGKSPLSSLFVDDPLYIQPTLGVNGVVKKLPGVVVPGEVYPGIPFELRIPDANTPNPGGRSTAFGEFEVILGSENRDIISGGNPDGPMTIIGNGGDDVLYSSQMFSAVLEGGEGNDVLGSYNHTLHLEKPLEFYDPANLIVMRGGSGDDSFVAGQVREQFDGGADRDLLTYEVSTKAVSVNLKAQTLDGGYATGDILVGGIENVTGSQFDDDLTGDDGANELIGWDGDDTLMGLDGADVLFGNDGDDELFGGDGNDELHGGNGADLLDGGEGTDAASWNLLQRHPKNGIDRLTNDLTGVTADLQTGVAGNDTLVGIENLIGGVGNDRFFGDGTGNFLAGNIGDDSLDGRAGDDVLVGGAGDDTLFGGLDDDFLSGGAGTNSLDGGAGTDIIDYGVLTYGVQVVMAGVGSRTGMDTGEVKSFTPVEFFVWTDSLTTTQGPSGAPGDIIPFGTDETRFTYQIFDQGTDDPSDDIRRQEDPITPERIWQLDPFFADEPSDLDRVRFLFDKLLPEQEVTAIERFVAATDFFKNIEWIVGSQGDDSFLGNGDNTLFYGGLGADTIDGGAGSDTASYLLSDAAVNVDLQNSTFGGGDAEGDELVRIENLIGSAYDDVLAGDAKDNRLNGRGGNDTMSGGAGTDTAVFDVASTEVIVARTTTGVRIILADGGIILFDDHVADDVEFFEFTDKTLAFSDVAGLIVSGTSASEELIGTAIADNIRGGGGNDTIFGRGGTDELFGGTGQDSLLGENGDDTLRGNAGDDRLNGGEGADVLFGGVGRDHFVGGAGDDTFVVDRADEITVEAPGKGHDLVRATVSVELQSNVEDLSLTEGAGNINGTGNGLDNRLTGNESGNRLIGRAGNDTLDGGAGPDTLFGGAGDDYYILSGPEDTLTEGANAGQDTVEAGFSMTLGQNVEGLVLTGSEDLTGTGNALNNTLTGNSGDNTLSGLAGDDLFHGSAGDDLILGGKGNDTLTLDFDLADAKFDFDSPGFFLMESAFGTDRVEDVEVFQFADQTISYEDLRDSVIPPQHVQLFAADYFLNKRFAENFPGIEHGIDNSPEGGGTQFLNVGPARQGSNPGNEFHFTAEFLDGGGRAQFQGTGFLNVLRATVSSVKVDFTGGNSNLVAIDFFNRPFLDMIDADWGYYETNIFSGNDRLIGSYFSDTLVGYEGDDTIFGGLGDKEKYDISDTPHPSPRPSTIRQAGQVTSNSDHLINDGDDVLRGEGGNDLIDGGTGNDTLEGGDGNDKLWGGAVSIKPIVETDPDGVRSVDVGADLLDGGDGDDTLDGDGGNDTLIGGRGADVFIVDMGMGNDTIFDFNGAEDSLNFDALSAAELAAVVDVTNADGIRTLTLSDGSVLTILARSVAIAGLSSDETLTGGDGNDSLDGNAGNDSISGLLGADELRGGAGSDTLDGGSGADTMRGGAGDDLYRVSDAGDVVIEDLDAGNDTVEYSADGSSYTLADNVENLRIDPGVTSLDVFGNLLDNSIDGGGVAGTSVKGGRGNDTIRNAGIAFGGDGDDTLNGSAISAQLHGDAGNDRINGGGTGERISGGTGNDTANGGGGNDTISGSSNDSSVYEDGGNDSLSGGGGNDALTGGLLSSHPNFNPGVFDGDDTLNGGVGNDTLTGGTGNDSLRGGTGTDLAIFSVASGDIVVTHAAGGLTVTSADGVDFVGNDVENLQFSDKSMNFAQVLALAPARSTPGNDALDGTSGNDTIDALAGNDTVLGLDGDDSLRGNDGADHLDGGNGKDTLEGGNGNDLLEAGKGNDVVRGGAGDDEISGQGGRDTLEGGDGDDLLRGGKNEDLMSGDGGVDKLFGQAHGDTLNGGAGNDRLNGGGGNDVLNGDAGNDFLKGGSRKDKLDGGSGNDKLFGNSFNDTLNGGAGNDLLKSGGDNDVLNGGTGNDKMKGGGGDDTFIFADGHGDDTIKDFEATNDAEKIDLSGVSAIGNIGDLTGAATQAGANVVINTGGGNSIQLNGVDLADLGADDFLFGG